MKRYLVRRILQTTLLIPVVIVLVFTMVSVAPGDTAAILAGEMADPQYVEALRRSLGLDRPFWEQLARYSARVVRADLGYSFAYRQPVVDLILERLPATLLLMVSGLVLAAITGLVLGVIAAARPHSMIDHFATTTSLVAYSLPVFWLGMVLIIGFSVVLGWFPMGGIRSLRVETNFPGSITDMLKHLALPAMTLGFRQMAVTARLVRGTMLEQFRADYVRTARSKGLLERAILFRHVLRNALLPVVTIWGLQFGTVMSGAVLTETVFSWPGLGRLMFDAVNLRDYPVLIGMLIGTAMLVALLNLVADVLYAVLDPRIRYA
jgi:peptide/nickel transport system permease protein